VTPTEAVEAAYSRVDADGRPGIWIRLVERDEALAAAQVVELRQRAGEQLPLAGRTLAVKDNIDVRGMPTTAGCPAFAYVADHDAACVAALVEAGAVVVGKTNMDQFATGLVGTRSPYGVCPNAHWPELISGGSSSGSAVAVAAGHVDVALGTDTAGSGRVPAACNGIVGLKPTRGRVSIRGIIAACRSLDCVSVFGRSIDDAALVSAIAQRTAPDTGDPWSRAPRLARPVRGTRVGVAAPAVLDVDGDPLSAVAFAQLVDRLDSLGFDVHEIDLGPFVEAGRLLYEGAFVAERYESVGAFIAEHPHDVHPVVGEIILAAGRIPAWRAFRDRTQLRRLATQTATTWAAVDALIVPSVPRIPTVREVLDAPIERNARLGTYTNFVNLLDLCALTLPVGLATASAPPFSATLIAPAWRDDLLVTIGRRLMSDTLATHRTM
jgi:allophanate hydrolase